MKTEQTCSSPPTLAWGAAAILGLLMVSGLPAKPQWLIVAAIALTLSSRILIALRPTPGPEKTRQGRPLARRALGWPRVQAPILSLMVLGLAASIDRIGAWTGPAATVFRLELFGVTVLAMACSMPGLGGLASRPRLRLLSPDARGAAWLVAGGSVALITRAAWQETTIVLLAAGIEELVFRRYLPLLLRSLGSFRDSSTRWQPILLSQAVFAVSHFVVRNHPSPFGDGQPFLRLFAAGCFLAAICGTLGLQAAVLLHFALNEMARTGIIGTFTAPSNATILMGVMTGVMLVVYTSGRATSHRTRNSPSPGTG